ncbi:MAG: Mrp/NBP35 family ATP-binding protein [Myxococcales bacterium FL481]|nr:MAG: Mrp/NBP35 family ATP-binding protein [Myxococcales bacterium FL481]
MSKTSLEDVRAALSQVRDPAIDRELGAGGQLTDVAVVDEGHIDIGIKLISPGYPLREALEQRVAAALKPFGLTPSITYSLDIPHRPARQDLNRLPGVKNVLAVAAGKGGVGKSTTSVNLALALRSLGARVGLLDADIYGPSLPKMLGRADSPCDASTEKGHITPAIYRGMPVMSVDFFVESGKAVVWRGPMIHKLLTQFLEDVRWGELDYLVVDLPPGTGDAQLSLGQLIPITGAVMVTTPQEVALLDVRKAVDMFKTLEVPVLGVLENMSYYQCPACGHHDSIFASGGGQRLADELEIQLLGKIPIDTRISHGGETGVPVVEANPHNTISAAFCEAAATAALELAKRSSTGPRRSTKLRMV